MWLTEEMPGDFYDAPTMGPYKNKGNKSDCRNYRAISLQFIVGKSFVCILLNRLVMVS